MWDTPDRSRLPGVLVQAIADAGAAPPLDLPPGPPIFRFSDEAELRGLLGALDDVQVETVSFLHRVPSADALWDGLPGGTVRLSVLIRASPRRCSSGSARPSISASATTRPAACGDPDLRQARLRAQVLTVTGGDPASAAT